MKQVLLGMAVSLLFISCEKHIDFDLKYAEPVLVVDAQIENGQAPIVILNRSLDYFGAIDPQVLFNSFVRNAVITISNGTLTHTLKEYALSAGNGFSFYYYSIDSSNLATAFTGEFNKQYDLSMLVEGKTYTARTTIPQLARIFDSLWIKMPPSNVDTNRRILMARVVDPPGLGNYIRYFTKKNSERFLPGSNSVFSDEIIDGTIYQVQVEQGVDRNAPIPSGDERFFSRGDTITFKLSNIDRASYNFWNTWEFNQQSIGNPFSQPNKVLGNISNGALGAFCGYASQLGTIIAR